MTCSHRSTALEIGYLTAKPPNCMIVIVTVVCWGVGGKEHCVHERVNGQCCWTSADGSVAMSRLRISTVEISAVQLAHLTEQPTGLWM